MRPKKDRFLFNVLWSATFSIVLFGIYAFNIETTVPPLVVPKQESAVNLNEKVLSILSMGNKRMISSLLWVQTLLESDISHYKKKDLNSWMYLRFRSIITIDPNFYEAYYYGGQYLSVIKDDLLGADQILEAGIKIFPDDFWLNYFLGFHAYFEMGDTERAYKYYERILTHPLTKVHIPFLPSLMAKLKAEQGEYNNAYLLLKTALKKTPEGVLKEKYKQNIYALKAQIDLACLNGPTKSNCDLKDAEGQIYLKSPLGKYYAQKSWQVFRVKKHKKKVQEKNKGDIILLSPTNWNSP